MLIKIYSIIYFLSLHSYTVLGYNCSPNDEDFTKGCDIVQTAGYKYTHFFPVEKLPNGDIFLRFYVKAEESVYILFYSDNPRGISKAIGRHYEIAIGAYNNFKSVIKTTWYKPETVAAHDEKHILTNKKWREFWIKISTDGLIQVGKDLSKDAFMSWTDPNTFEINYYSFSCYAPDGVTEYKSEQKARFIHQCSTTNYIKYNVDKFKCNLLSKYDQRIPPLEAAYGILHINITSSYAVWDAVNGIFQLTGNAKVMWQDSRLSWEPIAYYNVTSLDLTDDPIWRPKITLTNAAFENDKPFSSGKTRLFHDGVVSWIAPFTSQTKCNLTGSSEVQKCPINLTINSFGSRIHISDITQGKVSSPWGITKTEAVSLKEIDNKSSSHSISIEIPLKKIDANTQASSGNFCKCDLYPRVDIYDNGHNAI